jgi:hypothetical protein
MKQFSSDEINKIYTEKVKLPISYFKKYENVPPCPVKAWNYSWGGNDFPRVWTILDFKEWIQKYNIKAESLAYTCSSDLELEFIESTKKTYLNYPPYDLHQLNFKEEFDFFLFNQTIEHLYNPFMAIENIYNSLKPGGFVFTSVPTLNIPHMTPIHFNGYTPMGLAMLFKSVGFEIIEIGQWGNFDYIQYLWKNHSWPGYDKLSLDGKITNEESNCCQCWILAKKI